MSCILSDNDFRSFSIYDSQTPFLLSLTTRVEIPCVIIFLLHLAIQFLKRKWTYNELCVAFMFVFKIWINIEIFKICDWDLKTKHVFSAILLHKHKICRSTDKMYEPKFNKKSHYVTTPKKEMNVVYFTLDIGNKFPANRNVYEERFDKLVYTRNPECLRSYLFKILFTSLR